MLIAGGGGSYPSFPDVYTAVNKVRLQAANCEEENLEENRPFLASSFCFAAAARNHRADFPSLLTDLQTDSGPPERQPRISPITPPVAGRSGADPSRPFDMECAVK